MTMVKGLRELYDKGHSGPVMSFSGGRDGKGGDVSGEYRGMFFKALQKEVQERVKESIRAGVAVNDDTQQTIEAFLLADIRDYKDPEIITELEAVKG